ncbi:hypothetical protein UC34_12155 [Pandoraea vervacti]|uniref:Uncharacterized protein n=1 Tax=Pandoraea vervacti TaxID=656178 RepID=A0ABM5SYB4_9BURK|nr:hypothetical protein [Pandoraea vervacti]AJP57553.1 hypothetical protein UC34_12155 [Pandoraea vervacti]
MPRSSPHFDDATLNLLYAAARQADAAHRDSNTAFLDQFIRDALRTTHRLHSAQTYLRVLAGAGIERLPSAGTVQRAITRARTGTASETGDPGGLGMRAAAQQTLAQHVARVMALLSPDGSGLQAIDHAGEPPFDAADAYRRLQRLEGENRALRVRAEELTAMLMAARVALAEALSHHGSRPDGLPATGARHAPSRRETGKKT